MAKVGAAILCYEGFSDFVRCIESLKKTTPHVPVIVFDNSEKTTKIKDYTAKHCPNATYLTKGKNVGCTQSRNIMVNQFCKDNPDGEFLAIIDQDIEMLPGWLDDMMEVMAKHKDCAVAAWPMAFRYKTVHDGGLVTEVASMCNFHRVAPLHELSKKWGQPFDERFFFHKFDSLVCQRLNQIGWRTRLVMKYYKRGIPWSKQKGGIVHRHPNSGIKRNPRWRQICQRSKKIYASIQRDEGWSNWGCNKVPVMARENVN
jgi:GT2 family glycosyltransferase